MNKIFELFRGLFCSRRRAVFALIIVGILGFLIIRAISGNNQPAQVQTQTVERGTIVASISASGQVLTANIVNITSGANGMIKAVYVADGDKVSQGQKIMEITLDSDAQQQAAAAWSSYLGAKNSLESAKTTQYSLQSDMFSKWKTFKDLAESSSYDTAEERALPQFHIAEKDWLAAEAKYKNQQNVVSQAQAARTSAWLSYQNVSPIVTAPMAGVITNITYVPGMTIVTSADSGQRIAVIKSEGTPIATFNISEIDVSKVGPGQKATVKLDSIADKTFTGKVLSVDRIGTVTSGVTSYPAVIQFDTEASEILPNMSATANIILETKDDVLLVPSSAVQRQGDQSIVRILKGKQEQTVSVETGLTSDTQTEILSGLSEGDEVVILTSTVSQEQGRSVFGIGSFGGGPGGAIFRR